MTELLKNKIKATISFENKETKPFVSGKGRYHLARLDKQGQEVPGSDFSIGEGTYLRTYEKLTRGEQPLFILKKKA